MEIIPFVSALGFGSLIGIVCKSIFDSRLQNRKMLFEARTKAYAGITGRIFNLFQEPDIQQLPDPVKFVKINAILSEIMLLGSRKLIESVGEYKVKVYEFHLSLGSKDDETAERLHKELLSLVEQIHTNMRRDLYVDRKSAFGKGKNDS
jgi:hypothetical protein